MVPFSRLKQTMAETGGLNWPTFRRSAHRMLSAMSSHQGRVTVSRRSREIALARISLGGNDLAPPRVGNLATLEHAEVRSEMEQTL